MATPLVLRTERARPPGPAGDSALLASAVGAPSAGGPAGPARGEAVAP